MRSLKFFLIMVFPGTLILLSCGVKSSERSLGSEQSRPTGKDGALAPVPATGSQAEASGKDASAPRPEPNPDITETAAEPKSDATSKGAPSAMADTKPTPQVSPRPEGEMPPLISATVSSDDIAVTPLIVISSSGGETSGSPTIGLPLPTLESSPAIESPSTLEVERLWPSYRFGSAELTQTILDDLRLQCFMFNRLDPLTSPPTEETVSICKVTPELESFSDFSWSFSLTNCPEGALKGARTLDFASKSYVIPGTLISIPIGHIDTCATRNATLSLKFTRIATGASTLLVLPLTKKMISFWSFNVSYSTAPGLPTEPMINP